MFTTFTFASATASYVLFSLRLLASSLSFEEPMAARRTRSSLPSDPDFLLDYIDGLPDESDSDDDFEGYLDEDDGPVAYRSGHCPDFTPPLTRSRSLDSLGEAERQRETVTESPIPGGSPSLSPMQGHHDNGSPLAPPARAETSPTHSASATSSSSHVFTSQVNNIHNE